IGPRVQMVVVGDLPHVVVEEPSARILRIGDLAELALEDIALGCRGCFAVRAENGHRHVARIAIDDDEAKRLVELRVPLGGAGELAELTDACHGGSRSSSRSRKKASTRSSAARVGLPGRSTRSTVSTECALCGMPWGLPGPESISMASKPSPSSRRSRSNRSAGHARSR